MQAQPRVRWRQRHGLHPERWKPTSPMMESILRDFAPLPREDERALFLRWRDHGDLAAGHRLVMTNMRLAALVASDYGRAGVACDDLMQIAFVAMIEALSGFDPDLGRFGNYAVWAVRSRIQQAVLSGVTAIRLPMNSPEALRLLGRRKPGVAPADLPQLIRLNLGEDNPLTESVIAEISMAHDDGASDRGVAGKRRALVRRALGALSDRHQEIITRRHLCESPATLDEIGRDLGVSRQRVCQIEAKALEKFRAALAVVGIDAQTVKDFL